MGVTEQVSIHSFGEFSLNLSARTLNRGSRLIPLTPKEFQTLVLLVESAGKAVRKEDLIRELWPDTHVGDTSLARNISKLRRHLGPEAIQTISKFGYRFNLGVNSSTMPSRAEENVNLSPVVVTLEPLREQEAGTASSTRETAVDGPSRGHPGVVIGSATAAVLLIALAVFHSVSVKGTTASADKADTAPIHSIVIEKNGGIDPLDEGFKLYQPQELRYERDHVLYNQEMNGWDRWRIRTDSQNYYYRPLSAAEEDFALQRDWKLTCIGFDAVDLGNRAGRFDIEFLQEGDRYFVALTKQISPEFVWAEKIEFSGVADIAHPHTYELRFEHLTQSASLWIDGQQMSSGYRGHHQFLEGRGLMFGTAIYRNSERGSFVFRTVRFEAN
jgi:DNA-binding winged helix-turn-helix (wHTH) protein